MPYDPHQIYQPEADTRLLLAAVHAEVKPEDRVLEVGTGSGMVAAGLLIEGTVVATDINPHAVQCARNAGVEVIRCNLADAIGGKFDLIFFNPPYLPTQPHERIDDWLEYALDGGTSGRETIDHFISGISRVLAPGGRILLLISSLTGRDEVIQLAAAAGFRSEIVRQDFLEDEILYVLRLCLL